LGLLENGRRVALPWLYGFDCVDLKKGKGGEHDSRSRLDSTALPEGAPVIVGKSLVSADDSGRVCVFDLEDAGVLRWAFQLPRGVTVTDLVHTGKRLYVTTSIGLFCLADDEEKAAVQEGFVLEWDGDPRRPSYATDDSGAK
jgi:hypothetical protein